MEIRIWEGSPLIGMNVAQIVKKFKVRVVKVARGKEAANPGKKLELEAADYITYTGDSSHCLNLLEKAVK